MPSRSAILSVLFPLVGGSAGFMLSRSMTPAPVARIAGPPNASAQTMAPPANPVASWHERITAAADLLALIGLWSELQAHPQDALSQPWLVRELLDRMVRLDAVAGSQWAGTFAPKDPLNPRGKFMEAWAAVDHLAVAAAILKEPGEHGGDLDIIAHAWAEADPAAFLKQGPPAEWHYKIRHELRIKALTALGQTDLPAALALTKSMDQPHAFVSKDLLSTFAHSMIAERGVEGALAWAKEMADWPEDMRNQLQASVLEKLALGNPTLAAQEYAAVAAQSSASTAAAIAYQLCLTDPSSALKWAATLKGSSEEPKESALAKIAVTIGPDAKALLSATAELENPSQYAYSFIAGLTHLPAKPLIQNLLAEPASERRDQFITASLLQWSRNDPVAAMALFKEIGAGLDSQATRRFLSQFANHENSGVSATEQLALADQLGIGTLYFNRSWLKRLRQEDPLSAIGKTLGNNASNTPFALAEIYKDWTEAHPQAAADHIANLPPEKHQEAIYGLVDSWTKFDPMAASVWATQLPPGDDKDAAASSLASALIKDEPDPPLPGRPRFQSIQRYLSNP